MCEMFLHLCKKLPNDTFNHRLFVQYVRIQPDLNHPERLLMKQELLRVGSTHFIRLHSGLPYGTLHCFRYTYPMMLSN